MTRFYIAIPAALTVLLLCGAASVSAAPKKGADPWASLQKSFPQTSVKTRSAAALRKTRPEISQNDPWARLREIVVPFSLADDERLNRGAGAAVAEKVRRKLKPWRKHIERAARLFQVPTAIIEAVIMVESGGNPQAQAKSSSAAGLMQTIKATFAAGRSALLKMGLDCADNPYDPEASILVGSWYLGQMFDRARADGKPGVGTRSAIKSWRYPLQYYYSGPGHGRKAAPRILIYSGGEQILIDKPAYSHKVMVWAESLVTT